MHDDFCNMPGALSLICSYTLCGDAVETHWSRRARCVHAVDAKWQLFARHEHAMSAPWTRSQSPVRTPWERGGTPWHSSATPLSPWARRDISALWKIWNYALYFVVFSCDPTACWERLLLLEPVIITVISVGGDQVIWFGLFLECTHHEEIV